MDDPEMRALLARRLGLFTAILGGALALPVLTNIVLMATSVPEEFKTPWPAIGGAAAIGVLLLVGLKARHAAHSFPALTVLHTLATFVPLVAVAASVLWAPVRIEMIALLVMCVTLVLRAALIPGPSFVSIFLGVITSVPFIVTTAVRAFESGSTIPFLTPAQFTLMIGVWCLVIVVVSYAVSKIVYNLHDEVHRSKKVGSYTLEKKLGEGSFGEVWRAKHAMLRRPTAVKLLLPDRTGESLMRFEREVQTTSTLTHPNTVAIYDFGRTREGLFYYAMEYVEGVTLERLVRQNGPQAPGRVAQILHQAAGALAEAHRNGLIHRDLKPSNLMLCERGGVPGFVKVLDFGLVKELNHSEDVELTQAHALMGTPAYLAPETINAPEDVGAGVDIYGLGAVGYFLLTGHPPFSGKTIVEIAAHHLHTVPVSPSERLGKPVPPKLEALILRCLAKRPEDRPRNGAELARLLEACMDESPWSVDDERSSQPVEVAEEGTPEPELAHAPTIQTAHLN
jgi:serine/threonine-protein kinase